VDGKHLVAFTSSASGAKSFLIGIETDSGQVLWSYPVGGGRSVPLAVHGVVYFPDGFTLDAVRLSDGHLLWQEPVPDHTDSQFEVVTAAEQANVLYVATSPFVGEDPLFDPATCACLPAPKVYALNAGDGAAYWQYRPPVTWDSGLFLQTGRSV
jgi:outer membrane protein assembly factor BamB